MKRCSVDLVVTDPLPDYATQNHAAIIYARERRIYGWIVGSIRGWILIRNDWRNWQRTKNPPLK